MKRLSKWSSKAEVQRWDTCEEPTEWLLIGCLTELIWTTKNSKTHMLTPKKPTRRHIDKRINTSHFSSWLVAPKRWQWGYKNKKEDKIVAKSKRTALNLTSTVPTSSSSMNSPTSSKSLGNSKHLQGNLDARARRNSKPDAVSSSQGRLKDAYFGGLMVWSGGEKPAATDLSQDSWVSSDSESLESRRSPRIGSLQSWSDHRFLSDPWSTLFSHLE